MERIREGDLASPDVLVNRYWSPLVAYAAGIVGDRDMAEDVVQKTFISVWTNRNAWDPLGPVSAYLYRITRNFALNACRDEEMLQKRYLRAARVEPGARDPRTPAEELELGALRAEVEAAIARLSKRRRQVFVFSRLHNLTHREIAERFGTSPQTVSNQMSAALATLREELIHLRKCGPFA